MTGRIPAVALALLWLGVVLLFWLGLFVPSMQPGLRRPIDADLYGYFAPKYFYGNQELASGRLPLWNPYEYGGLPFLGAAQPAALYPPKIAIFALAGRFALHVYMIFHLVVAGLVAWVAFRGLGLGAAGAMLGVVTWVFSAINMDSLYHPFRLACLTWAPAAFLAFVRLVEEPGPRRAVVLAIVVTLMLLAGYPEYALDTAVALGVFALVSAPALGWRNGVAPRLGWLALAAALAVALSALQLFPVLDMASQSWRVGTADVSGGRDFLALVTPALIVEPRTWRALAQLYAQAFHMAPVAWLLAVAGAVFAVHPLRIAFLTTWVALVAFATVLAGALHALPIFALLRGSYCWMGLAYFPAGWLAGAGLDAVLAARDVPASRAGARAWIPFAVVVAATAAVIPARSWVVPLLATAVIVAVRRAPAARAAAPFALVGLALFSQWTWNPPGFTEPVPHRYARKEPPYPPVPPRAFGLAAALRGRCATEPYRILAPWQVWSGTAIVERVEMAQGYPESIAPGRMRRLLAHATLDVEQQILPDWDRVAANGAVLDMLNVGCVLVPALARLDVARLGLVEAARLGLDVAYRRASPLPRAFLVRRARAVPDGDAALDAVTRPAFDPAAEVVLETDALPPLAPGEGSVAVTATAPGAVDLAVETTGAALLVVSQTFFPGWRAAVDGRPVPVERADYVLMAVAIPPGTHRVALRYRPSAALVGGALSALGAVAALALARVPRRWSRA